jgi:amidohydrolase
VSVEGLGSAAVSTVDDLGPATATTVEDLKAAAASTVEAAHPALIELSHRIHDHPEVGHQEDLASGWLTDALEGHGFTTRRGLSGMATAVEGTLGSGPLHIVLCAEYDALPGVGHACAHNVICAMSLGAGLALAPHVDALGLRLTVLGTPAEEGGGGKVTLVRDGYFDDVHAALMVHPFAGGDVAEPAIIAVGQLTVTYLGRAAHAAAYPHTGLNAADALVVAQTAIALLRQQLLPTDRVHGIVVKGGEAANIIPAETRAEFMVRGTTRARMNEVVALVRRCFEAGALATGCEVSIVEEVPYSDMHHDHELAALYRRQAESLGRTFGTASVQYSTDMGDVSYVIPAIHPNIGLDVDGAVNHQAEFAAASVAPEADRLIREGAVAMAWTVIEAARDDAIRARLLGH